MLRRKLAYAESQAQSMAVDSARRPECFASQDARRLAGPLRCRSPLEWGWQALCSVMRFKQASRPTSPGWVQISSLSLRVLSRQSRRASLLTVQPTEKTLDQSARQPPGRYHGGGSCSTPARLCQVVVEGHRVNLIAIDPRTDFTVRNWLQGRADEPLTSTDILAGSSLPGQMGETMSVCGSSMKQQAACGKRASGLSTNPISSLSQPLRILARKQVSRTMFARSKVPLFISMTPTP